MDIIIDTNILYKDPHLRSLKSQAVFDYLEKTNSHLIIPTVVREEIIALYRRTLLDLRARIKNTTEKIDHLCSSDVSKIEIYLDVDKEVSAYQSYMHNLTHHGGGALELPYRDEFLSEVIRRLVERVKPASNKGMEFRDIVIWLSIKEFLKSSNREAIFISENTAQFADRDSKELHPDLARELSKDNLKLIYFPSVDDFIRQHSSKIEYINDKWIDRVLRQQGIEKLVADHIEYRTFRVWDKHAIREGYLFALPMQVNFKFGGVGDFYIYELEGGDVFLHASCMGTISGLLQMEHTSQFQPIFEEVIVEVECNIHEQKLQNLRIEWWDSEGEKLDFAAKLKATFSSCQQPPPLMP